MLKISDNFWIAVKTSRMRGYEIANHAGILPQTLSKLLWEVRIVRPGDPRWNNAITVGRVLGLKPDECFTEADKEE